MTNPLQGKAAIVTGAGGGIGRAISIAFAQAGARVACVDLNLKNAEESVRLAGEGTVAIQCDVSSEPDTKAEAVGSDARACRARTSSGMGRGAFTIPRSPIRPRPTIP